MTTDLMLAAAAQLASVTAAVWVLTEVVGRATGWNKAYLALAFGPLLGLAAYGTGFLTALPPCPFGGPVCQWAGAGFAGLVTTLVAKGFHDLLGDRILRAVQPEKPQL